MKSLKGFILLLVMILCHNHFYSQESEIKDWNKNEKKYYKTLVGLVKYLEEKKSSEISRDILCQKFFYLDNILKDTTIDRRNKRLVAFDSLFKYIPKTLDSIGSENLDAKPIRFYRGESVYKPFERALAQLENQVLVYYKKEDEENPLGYLLFDDESSKLISWILLKQGESGWFFLTLNLL